MISRVILRRKIYILLLLVSVIIAEVYVSDYIVNKIEKKYGIFAKNRFILLNETMAKAQDLDELKKLRIINDFYNEVSYKSDLQNYHLKDYWATPLEFLGRDRGDCEDYVIAKYFALKDLGITGNKLYFTYVKSRNFKDPHMVLTYFSSPTATPLILDNYNKKILPASQRKDLIPVYNFNGQTLYIAQKKGLGKKVKLKQSYKEFEQLLDNIQRSKL